MAEAKTVTDQRPRVDHAPSDAWAIYERRLPNFRERMLQARRDLRDGKGEPLGANDKRS